MTSGAAGVLHWGDPHLTRPDHQAAAWCPGGESSCTRAELGTTTSTIERWLKERRPRGVYVKESASSKPWLRARRTLLDPLGVRRILPVSRFGALSRATGNASAASIATLTGLGARGVACRKGKAFCAMAFGGDSPLESYKMRRCGPLQLCGAPVASHSSRSFTSSRNLSSIAPTSPQVSGADAPTAAAYLP